MTMMILVALLGGLLAALGRLLGGAQPQPVPVPVTIPSARRMRRR